MEPIKRISSNCFNIFLDPFSQNIYLPSLNLLTTPNLRKPDDSLAFCLYFAYSYFVMLKFIKSII